MIIEYRSSMCMGVGSLRWGRESGQRRRRRGDEGQDGVAFAEGVVEPEVGS